MKSAEAKNLARAVQRWLVFQKLCGRGAVFSENHLSHPIADFVSVHYSGEIRAEYSLPQFPSSIGRPRQVDFALTSAEDGSVETIIESKWVGHSRYSKQAIVDDLLRLQSFRPEGNYLRRYFLVAGLASDFKRNFRDLCYRDSGRLRPFLGNLLKRTFNTHEIGVRNTQGPFRKYYRRFEAAYGVEIPKKFQTTLVYRSYRDEVAVFLWRINSAAKHGTFSPQKCSWPR